MERVFKTRISLALILAGLAFTQTGFAGEMEPIPLPNPQKTGGMPLLDALGARKTVREIGAEKINLQVLSNLLWAANGINRPKGPKGKAGRTAPSAMNFQEIDVYVALSGGVFIYDAAGNRLTPVTDKDVRSKTNRNPAVGKAPVVLLYVENLNKGKIQPPAREPVAKTAQPTEPARSFGEVDAGFIGQNVYLFAASEGLAAWFFVADPENLIMDLKLNRSQRLLYGQAVGRPAKAQ